MDCTRRVFLTTASGVAVSARMAAASVQGANNRVRVAIIGTGGRARGLMNQLKPIAGVEIVGLCDVFEPRLLQAAEIAGPAALKTDEYRRILDNKEIDAVLIGSPDHWHKTDDARRRRRRQGRLRREAGLAHDRGGRRDGEGHRGVEADRPDRHPAAQLGALHPGQGDRPVRQAGPDHVRPVLLVSARAQGHVAGRACPTSSIGSSGSARAKDQPFHPERFYQWRHFWDFGGGQLTDLMTHWIDVVHWYMNVEAPISAYSSGKSYNMKMWEAPDTVRTTLEFPNNFTCAHLGTYVSRVDDGGLEFRGELGTLKIDRARLAFYKDDAPYTPGTLTPQPEI